MARSDKKRTDLPSRDELLRFIEESSDPVGVREIARAFGLRAGARGRLKQLLHDLRSEGLIGRGPGGVTGTEGLDSRDLPKVLVVEVSGTDSDGELLARPASWRGDDDPPTIYLAPERRGQPALTRGDRALVRLQQIEPGVYEGRPIRVLGAAPRRLLGVYDANREGGRLRPTDRRIKSEFALRRENAAGAESGELVLVEPVSERPKLGRQEVRVVERFGGLNDNRALSLIAIQEHNIPSVFDEDALAEAEAAQAVPEGPDEASPARLDLRELDLVTIDGADARDFDDAVWAEADPAAENSGGWHLIVAIADVAHYVRPGSALDRTARERGNSAYFPDRVVPMLPEALSNGWCSLKPDEIRPCLAAELWIDKDGSLLRHRFQRALMRSRARLTYEQVQSARDGQPDEQTKPLMTTVIEPLYGAFEALARGRTERGVLDLDLPERQVRFDESGRIDSIEVRERLDSHRLIEEFMITANVAAAEALENRGRPCLYRVHDTPDPQKLESLRQVLATMNLSLPRGQTIRPVTFNRILQRTAEREEAALVSRLVLQAQSQAAYAPRNIGHYGLALRRYAHFTSPIRRYADLIVHRSLISVFKLGDDGLDEETAGDLAELGRQVSASERRAQLAERDTLDRFSAAFLQDRIGARFTGRISGVTRFGLFATLDDSGADGLVPVSSLPDDRYDHDAKSHALVGRRWGRRYALGERVDLRLVEADPISGGLILNLEESTKKPRDKRRGRR